jgi:predicted Zn-dependent peptidase
MLTAELLKEGGAGGMKAHELFARIGSLGAELAVDTAFDHTTITIRTTRDQLEEAVRLMAAVVERPMFDAAELARAKKRAMDRADEHARASGAWAISMVLHRDLFDLPAEQHPYASFDATSAELSAITLADCRGHYARTFVPSNAFVAVAGGVKHAAVMAAAQKAFHAARAAAPAAISFTAPVPPESLKITLVDAPQSRQTELVIGMLGPTYPDDDFPAFAVASAVLGNALSEIHPAQTRLVELAHGPSLFTAHASVKTEATGAFVQALFAHLQRMEKTAPDDDAVIAASRSIVDGLAIRSSTVTDLAGELVRLRVLRLPDDHHDSYRKRLLDVTPALIVKTAGEYVRSDHAILVVAGDASVIGPALSRFGQVKVVDSAKGFARIRTIAMDATAPPAPP